MVSFITFHLSPPYYGMNKELILHLHCIGKKNGKCRMSVLALIRLY